MNMGRKARNGNPGEWVRHVEIMQAKTQQMRPQRERRLWGMLVVVGGGGEGGGREREGTTKKKSLEKNGKGPALTDMKIVCLLTSREENKPKMPSYLGSSEQENCTYSVGIWRARRQPDSLVRGGGGEGEGEEGEGRRGRRNTKAFLSSQSPPSSGGRSQARHQRRAVKGCWET